jgi:hypothetical protein
MRNFFQALSRCRVRYLLISGQATVLYGAATFSEDVDLWVEPSDANWRRLLKALQQCSARVYKLTPPLRVEFARRGHGFHFTIPDEESPKSVGYLDVMGVPPRVVSFRVAFKRARHFKTDWGRLPVVAPEDLVLLKKTRRLADYAVISTLVRITCRRLRSRRQWEWGLHQTFEAEDLLALWQRGRAEWRRKAAGKRPAIKLLQARASKADLLPRLSRVLMMEMETAREADRRYWKPILDELRQLQRRRKLLAEGSLVQSD